MSFKKSEFIVRQIIRKKACSIHYASCSHTVSALLQYCISPNIAHRTDSSFKNLCFVLFRTKQNSKCVWLRNESGIVSAAKSCYLNCVCKSWWFSSLPSGSLADLLFVNELGPAETVNVAPLALLLLCVSLKRQTANWAVDRSTVHLIRRCPLSINLKSKRLAKATNVDWFLASVWHWQVSSYNS